MPYTIHSFEICFAKAKLNLMSVLAPTPEILFLACPKQSIQKKRHPDAAYTLRSSLLNGVAERGFLPLRQRAASLRRPYRAAHSVHPCTSPSRVLRMQIGYPADLSVQKLRCSARHTGRKPSRFHGRPRGGARLTANEDCMEFLWLIG